MQGGVGVGLDGAWELWDGVSRGSVPTLQRDVSMEATMRRVSASGASPVGHGGWGGGGLCRM